MCVPFIDEEFTEESFKALEFLVLKELIPTAGPRTLFWKKFNETFHPSEVTNILDNVSSFNYILF